jgi:RimJ/RimL family protein N-acetyltransferase
MTTLADILWRNEGQRLTPELIVGLLHGAEYLLESRPPPEVLSTASIPLPISGDWVAAPNLRESNKRLVLDEHVRVAEWVAQQTGCSAAGWAGYVCLGLEDERGMLIAGVVLESYNGRNANVHIAGIGRQWLNRNMMMTFFHYCFNHLKLTRLTGLVPASNAAALAFDEHVGFKREAVLVDGAADGDLHVLVMRRSDCRYLPADDAGATLTA